MNKIFKSLMVALFISATLAGQAFSQGEKKIKINSADELPRRSYQLKGKALEILEDRKQMNSLADEIIKNLEADLHKYDIEDKATLDGYYSTLLQLYYFKGDDEKVLGLIPKIRALQTKESARLTRGVFVETLIKTEREVKDTNSPEFKKAFEKNYAAAYAKLPYSEIGESVEALKGSLTLQNPEVTLGGYESGFQPVLDNTKGNVPEGVPVQIIGLRFALDEQFPLKAEMMRVLNDLYEKNKKTVERANIWAERDVNLSAADKLNPVVAAVWDSGTDINVLPVGNRFINNKEKLNGKDDDGNGYIDDVSGIAYDLVKFEKAAGTLDDPKDKIKSDTKKLQRLVKGSLDLQSGINSPESLELQQTIGTLKREDVKAFQEELGFYSLYSHGTHVAGIVADGNPAARILAARMGWDYRALPQIPTLEQSKFKAKMYKDTVEYFKKQGVRVVNMSWRYNSASIEGALTVNNIGKDEAERKKLAREWFDIEKQALYEAIKNAPDILFVAGSGNEDNDANFSKYIPASLDLPNLITIGAVDGAGRKTSFTTEGKSVKFYANGYEVESFVPGGDRLKFSGTSMASPQVANLAAKLLAVNSKLKPAEIIKLIAEGADASSEDANIRLINPKKSLSILQK